MHLVHANIQSLYDNPDYLRQRLKLSEDVMRDKIESYSEERRMQIMERFYALWGHALSSWIFPDDDDYDKLL